MALAAPAALAPPAMEAGMLSSPSTVLRRVPRTGLLGRRNAMSL